MRLGDGGIRRFPISTPAVTTLLVFVAALVWGRASNWCLWWQVAIGLVAFLAIGLLVIRGVNRSRIENQRMLKRLDEMDESMRVNVAEAVKPLMEAQKNAERRLVNQLNEIQSLQERTLEASDPSYERPKLVNLAGSLKSGGVRGRASLQVIEPTKRERLRLRLIHALKWVWGTHDA